MKYSQYDHGNRRIIDKIMTIKQWNAECRPDEKINVKYGYVMPIYHGYDWKPTKKQLIEKYTY